MRRLLILTLCGGFLVPAYAQLTPTTKPIDFSRKPPSNLHARFIPVLRGPVRIDSLSLVPGTVELTGISDSSFQIDYPNATLRWTRPPNLDSVLIRYRVFPYRLNAVTKRLDYEKVMDRFLVAPETYAPGGRPGDNFFNFGNITYNGSFGRAISFGNSQDAVVTSNLNLQISGYLADSVEIAAAITDNNIPIQPDGTTAQLNDFDRIYLQFKKKNWALAMGDIDLRQNQNYFLNFYKRLRGGSFETFNQIAPGISNKTLVSGAVAKGKFTRNVFQGQEGNQGPYRLTGANNELYFIVLSGTEKVFIDGQQLQRGEDQDYIINYNTAEITFMPKKMITKDSRIQVEFEYSNQYFLNVNLYLCNELRIGDKLRVRLGVFNNSDARNSPISQTLDPNQKKFLNGLGDSVGKAFYPVAPRDTSTSGGISYRKADTVFKDVNGLFTHDSVFVFSVDKKLALYNLGFTNVGQGNGNYIVSPNAANGNVFQWIAPSGGVKQGQFDAAQFLVTPKTQQVYTLGADYSIGKSTVLSADVAGSRYDINTLSLRDKTNDFGYATKLLLKNVHPFRDSLRRLELQSQLSYEYVGKRFQPLERLRPVEFLRDWGLPLIQNPADETFYTAAFRLKDVHENDVRYELAGYNRGSSYSGLRNSIGHTTRLAGFVFNDQVSYMHATGDSTRGYLFRPNLDVSRTFRELGNYTAGLGYAMDRNLRMFTFNDSVSPESYSYSIVQAYLKSPEKNPNRWGATYFVREDAYPFGKALGRADRSQNLNVYTEFTKNTHEQFRFNATYRKLQVLNTKVTNQQADESILGRVEYLMNEWKGMLTGNALYEVGSGQEQKRAYSYIEVPAGTGQYAWIDLNADGIEQLNEFVLAQFPDQAKFIRVFTPTNEFVKANYNTLNYSFVLNPHAYIPTAAKGFRRFVARFYLQSSLQLTQKQQSAGFVQLNPFQSALNDTSLITRTSIFVNSIAFNKWSSKWGIDVTNQHNNSKSLLTYGYQTQSLAEWNLRGRYNISRSFLLNGIFRSGATSLITNSKNFDNSNYDVRQFSLEPDLSFTLRSSFRLTVGYRYAEKTNKPEYGGEFYHAQSFNVDTKYNLVQSTSLQGKFTFTNISYTGQTNSTVSYVLLDALLPGKNYLWSLDLTKRLGSNLELSIQYEGRKPGEGHTIHTGRAALRALL